jgi:amino acid transporter
MMQTKVKLSIYLMLTILTFAVLAWFASNFIHNVSHEKNVLDIVSSVFIMIVLSTTGFRGCTLVAKQARKIQ